MSRIEKRKYIIGSLLLLLQYYISSSVLLPKNGNTRGLYGWLIAFLEWLRNMYLRNKYDPSKDKPEYNSFITGWRSHDQRNSSCFYEVQY